MSELYREKNQFLYLHLNAAHESTGQHAITLDVDLFNTLSTYFTKYGDTHELVFFLHADHGMRYGNWFKEQEAY
jgi:hypothetical protein